MLDFVCDIAESYRVGQDLSGSRANRSSIELDTLALVNRGVQPVIVRLPLLAHQSTDDDPVSLLLANYAKQHGYVPYLGDGGNMWPIVALEDLGTAYVLAAEYALARLQSNPHVREEIVMHPVAELVTCREIVEKIAQLAGRPTKTVNEQEVLSSRWPILATFLRADARPESNTTRTTLGWTPRGPSYLDRLANNDREIGSVEKRLDG